MTPLSRPRANLLRAALLASACVLAPVASAHADAFDDVDVASDAELADARGGFLTADGITFDLGAIITTYQDGQLALQTQLSWTPTGAVATHLVGEQYTTTAADAALLAAAALKGGGYTVSDASGATQIFQGTDANSLRNLAVTSASNTNLAQDIQVTVTLPGFEAMQNGFALDQLGIRIGGEVGELLTAAGRL